MCICVCSDVAELVGVVRACARICRTDGIRNGEIDSPEQGT